MNRSNKTVVCFVTGSAGDWGGASRVLYTNLRQLDRSRIEPILLLPCDGPITPELDRLGLRYHIWGCPTEPADRFAYIRAFFRTLMLFRREKVQLVHFNNRPWRPAEALAARVLGIPILLHFHVVNEARSPVIAWARGAVVVSNFVRQASQPPDLEKFVVHNPVDLARFAQGRSLRDSLGIAPDNVIVSFVGQIREIKGVQDFIAMAQRLDDPNLCFLIAGECRDPAVYSGTYTEGNLREMINGDTRIRYIGYVERVEDVYATSDIVVVPSRWQEPLGLVAIEAAASRKPVVATLVGGLPEIIKDGQTGYLVKAGEPSELADRVRQLASAPSLRRQLGEASRERVAREFSERPSRLFEDLLIELARR